jgi:hypothetical protein
MSEIPWLIRQSIFRRLGQKIYLLWYPVFVPQMTGGDCPPDPVTVKVSV